MMNIDHESSAPSLTTECLFEAINAGQTFRIVDLLKEYNSQHPIIDKDSPSIRKALTKGDIPHLLHFLDRLRLIKPQPETISLSAVARAVAVEEILLEAISNFNFSKPLTKDDLKHTLILGSTDWSAASLHGANYAMAKYLQYMRIDGEFSEDTRLNLRESYQPEVKALISEFLLNKAANQDLDGQPGEDPIRAKRARI